MTFDLSDSAGLATGLLLAVHIACGAVALLAGTLALSAEKGAPLHRRAGRVFAPALAVSLATSLVLAVVHPNAFLFAIGLFSGYLLFAGWRAARRVPGRGRSKAPQLDRAAAFAMLLVGAAMAVAGPALFGLADYRGWVLPIFGLAGAGFALADLRAFAGAERMPQRVARHVTRMGGAFIATVTAVAVVNLTMLPDLVAWIGPSLVLSPLLAVFVARTLRGASRERPG